MKSLIMKSLMLLAFLSNAGLLVGQSLEPKFSELSRYDIARLDQQRALVARTAKEKYGTPALTGTKKDLPLLQRLIDDKIFQKSQTYELQSLGVVLGDVLASEFPLRWVIISDEYGTDPTLRYKNTSININALTMISQRIERDQPVNIVQLVGQTRQALSDAEKRYR